MNRTGMCIHEGCEKARSKEVQTVRMGKDFICEECKSELREVRTPPPINWAPIIAMIAGAIVIGAGVCSFVFKIPASMYEEPKSVTIEEIIEKEIAEIDERIAEIDDEIAEIEEEAAPLREGIVRPNSAETYGRISFPYGTYEGDLSNGYAEGRGKMRYEVRTLISKYDRKKRYAEPGQSIVGTWYSDNLDNGQLYDANGNLIEVISIGRAE